ncbi:MAG: M23 family metallopeptidase, partial [Brevefilum sp.]
LGIDIAAMHEDLIFAAASGIVVQVQRSYYGYGNMLIIDHLNGYQTLYAHLNSILAELDDFVIQGQPIGLAGSTGYSTGTHLHFEIHYEGRCVNPWHFLTR